MKKATRAPASTKRAPSLGAGGVGESLGADAGGCVHARGCDCARARELPWKLVGACCRGRRECPLYTGGSVWSSI